VSIGPDGATIYYASDPAVAYNPVANEYLITWEGDDDTDPLVDGEDEIFARRAVAGTPSLPPAPAARTTTSASSGH
jgi:hypothetical protein